MLDDNLPLHHSKTMETILKQRCWSEFPGVTWEEMNSTVASSPMAEDEHNFDCPEGTDEFVKKAIRYRINQRQELLSHSLSYLKSIVEEERLMFTAFLGNCDESTLQEFTFYNRPESKANVEQWLNTSFWTIEEAVSLSLGKDPRRVNSELLEQVVGFSSFVETYRHRLLQVTRAVQAGYLTEQIAPNSFIEWATQTAIDLPDELQTPESAHTRQGNDSISEVVKSSLQKMLLGMAVTHYGYDGGARRNTATGENRDSIASDLDKIGISLDPDTIRGHLKEAWDRYGNLLKSK